MMVVWKAEAVKTGMLSFTSSTRTVTVPVPLRDGLPGDKQLLGYMSFVRRFYPKLWTIPTGAVWGEVSCPGTQLHADCSGT